MIHPERIRALNEKPGADGAYVLYWMQASQRANWNHALEFAIQQANDLRLPVVAVFGITERYPDANQRHYAFMLEGLNEPRKRLAERDIRLVVRRMNPPDAALELAGDAAAVVCDVGYTRVQRKWREQVARSADCTVVAVETDVIVPVWVASGKEEYAARTIRPKIHKHLDRFMVPMEHADPQHSSLGIDLESMEIPDTEALLSDLRLNRDAEPVTAFRGGTSEAERLLEEFVDHKLADYAEARNDPAGDNVSHMSPYLQFGQISPLQVALAAAEHPGEGSEAFLEELIVRRELSMNFVHYNPDYDTYGCLPDWCRKTLAEHEDDPREYLYSEDELEQARTHDPYWNAAQREMVLSGKMHNYMRMYWGKKIIEWTASPQEAFEIALRLNNRYELDGRNPNSFAGVAWCFGKHDRPWQEREIFGTVRYMNAKGLERKFDMDAYVRKVEAMASGKGG